MSKDSSHTGSELFIVDNSDADWKVLQYLRDWCQLSKSIDIATGYFEIGSLLALKEEWQKVDHIRILMGDEVSLRTKNAFAEGLGRVKGRLETSIETEKLKNDFLVGVPAIVDAIRNGKITCRVYRKEKFHAKAYITHARLEVVGSTALVGSSNFTFPGLIENIELNVQITGRPVTALQEWYEQHWNEAEDVSPEILQTIERHTREYMPFEVYARALHELLRQHEMTDHEWLSRESRVYPILDQYQKDGFHELIQIANNYRGAFLCDGVGLGKTFIGLMLIEYLVERKRQRVALFVPKAARKPVWETCLGQYLPNMFGDFSNVVVFNHTDLQRGGEYPKRLSRLKEMADVILVDEAHHFRNPGTKGKEGDRQSRYWQLYDICEGKALFLLTATPVNNRLLDLQHMIELFSRRQTDYFKTAPLGIHSLAGHFRKMEKELEKKIQNGTQGDGAMDTNQVEAEQVLSNDALFRELVVQRSRGYVKESQKQHGGTDAIFPVREDPKVVPYSIKDTYSDLLTMIEQAFSKQKPLFSLAMYYPLAYYKGPDASIDPLEQGRQREVVALIRILFLKRFESSARAFELSCQTLLIKLLTWAKKHSQTQAETRRLERWEAQHADLIEYVQRQQRELFPETRDEEVDEDIVSDEMLEAVERLSRDEYKVEEILAETFLDLDQLAAFLTELKKFKPSHDAKLKALLKLLATDPVLKKHKVLIFSEFMATARYLKKHLEAADLKGVDEVDSATDRDRGEIIRQFAPYYNGSSSAKLKAEGLSETKVLISTDVLSEGLNLQDATRLINYDLHWNPVRLMQRIGRVDRRMNRDIETHLLADHPDQASIRGTVTYWNFLPPDDLDKLLRLYSRVAHKTLRISKTFGIEGKKLLKPEDDYEALRDFTHAYEGTTTPIEALHLEYQKLLKETPSLLDRINALPGKVFSGKAHPNPKAKAVFFCYAIPAPVTRVPEEDSTEQVEWTEEAGTTKWYLYNLATEKIIEEPTEIVQFIRCTPKMPRKHDLSEPTLSEIRAKLEKHIKNTYLKQVQAPIGVNAILKAWMELS